MGVLEREENSVRRYSDRGSDGVEGLDEVDGGGERSAKSLEISRA